MFQYGLNILAIIVTYCNLFGFIYGILYPIPSIFVFDMIIAKFGYQRALDMHLVMSFLSSQWNTTNYLILLYIWRSKRLALKCSEIRFIQELLLLFLGDVKYLLPCLGFVCGKKLM